MAINIGNKLLKYSGNQTTNGNGKPRMLLHDLVTTEEVPGNPQARVLNLRENEGCFYGDLFVSLQPTVPSAHADILVSDKVDYEISFWFYQNHEYPSIELSASAKNRYGYALPLYDIVNNVPRSHFLQYPQKACGTPGRWHFASYILYRHDIANIEKNYLGKQPLTSLGIGTNLVMAKDTNYVNIKLQNRSKAVKLYNFVVKPLRTPFSTGFLQSGDMLELWTKVNNLSISQSEIDRIAQQKLLPYNVTQAKINL